jgi:sigma-B regulation protein RsbU (phosphoserine phosphatase)
MAINLPKSSVLRARLKRILLPAGKWARITASLGALSLLLWLTDVLPGVTLGGWATFVTLIFGFFGLVLLFRWGYRPLLWRLRNRLIVTYLFIGVMPILLLLLMFGLAGYLFAGQFATYVAISDLHSELLHLQAANDALAAQLFPLEVSGKLNEQIAEQYTRASDERFPGRTVTVSRNGKSFILSTEGALLTTQPAQIAHFINGDFTGFVVDHDALHLRAIRLSEDGRVALISNLPITPNLLLPTAERLGSVTVLPLPLERKGEVELNRRPVKAGEVSPRTHWFDITLHFPTLFEVVDWQTGEKQTNGIIYVATRPSMPGICCSQSRFSSGSLSWPPSISASAFRAA